MGIATTQYVQDDLANRHRNILLATSGLNGSYAEERWKAGWMMKQIQRGIYQLLYDPVARYALDCPPCLMAGIGVDKLYIGELTVNGRLRRSCLSVIVQF